MQDGVKPNPTRIAKPLERISVDLPCKKNRSIGDRATGQNSGIG